ncbi:type 1 glutamine amidotransferase domain-containing protein [Glycomyces luteolus]|uniref:Type 1 glutamine amidotransferase domain-containing protein n=1 Tax=Glycomyces luteolus TaxID=2670330 RepID=A0A9X3T3I4_9ACTN|nr:type 1 glutamine amidotransferase domain-containing protein [Glycomyces luteolus]MDA1360040.1 type 1 glutamine amidotransferase domain-containing protein [Glycomyces luteolus]
MARMLFIMTGAGEWTLNDGTKHTTGYWAEEAVVPLEAFKHAGHEITVATPGGVVPPVDPASLTDEAGGGAETAAHLRTAVATADEFAKPADLADVDLGDYDAVYVPGGHGPMEDLAVNADSGRLLAGALRDGKPVGLVCHGLAALLAAEDEGVNAFAGYRVTGFTNAEEHLAQLADKAQWLLQDRLEAAGVVFAAADPFTSHVQVDRNLVTGQNPQSSAEAAEALIDLVG